jgi:hypothetical protein
MLIYKRQRLWDPFHLPKMVPGVRLPVAKGILGEEMCGMRQGKRKTLRSKRST